MGWGVGLWKFSLTFDEILEGSEDARPKGWGIGERMFWAETLRQVYTWCVGGTAESPV